MKLWRNVVIFTMILAMPISSWATVMMTSHCQASDNTPHSMTTQVNDSESIHEHDHMSSPELNDQSNCECDDNLNCCISGCISSCSSVALSNTNWLETVLLIHPVYQRVQSLADPSDPSLLFRPPI